MLFSKIINFRLRSGFWADRSQKKL